MDRFLIGQFLITLVWIAFISAIFFAFFFYLKFRNKERMMLIEKNADLAELYRKSEKRFPWLIIGFTILGIGLGFTLSTILVVTTKIFVHDFVELITISTAALFGAIGIIVGTIMERRKI